MTFRITFGCDPGLSGAIATLIDGEPGPILDMPILRIGEKNEVDAIALARFVRDMRSLRPGANVTAFVERVRAMPNKEGPGARKMGAQSSFNFGDGFGQVKATFRVLGIEPVFVEALTWKRHMGLLGQEKDAARLLAIRRFPGSEPDLRRKKDCGRADAMLVALWGYSQESLARAA